MDDIVEELNEKDKVGKKNQPKKEAKDESMLISSLEDFSPENFKEERDEGQMILHIPGKVVVLLEKGIDHLEQLKKGIIARDSQVTSKDIVFVRGRFYLALSVDLEDWDVRHLSLEEIKGILLRHARKFNDAIKKK